ncbi:hypothetical protein [Rhizobium leguminosarum]
MIQKIKGFVQQQRENIQNWEQEWNRHGKLKTMRQLQEAFKAGGDLLQKTIGFVQKQRENFKKRELAWKRNRNLKTIREFQEEFIAGGEVMRLEYSYTPVSESDLVLKTDEELDALVAECENGRKYIKSVKGELAFRTDAEKPSFEFKSTYVAPRNSMWLEWSRRADQIDPVDRHCLVLLRILRYYDYISPEEYQATYAAFLGKPVLKFADPDREKRAHETAAEILDRPFISVIANSSVPPKKFGYDKALMALNEQLKQRPDSLRINRLKKEFQAKGVLPGGAASAVKAAPVVKPASVSPAATTPRTIPKPTSEQIHNAGQKAHDEIASWIDLWAAERKSEIPEKHHPVFSHYLLAFTQGDSVTADKHYTALRKARTIEILAAWGFPDPAA